MLKHNLYLIVLCIIFNTTYSEPDITRQALQQTRQPEIQTIVRTNLNQATEQQRAQMRQEIAELNIRVNRLEAQEEQDHRDYRDYCILCPSKACETNCIAQNMRPRGYSESTITCCENTLIVSNAICVCGLMAGLSTLIGITAPTL